MRRLLFLGLLPPPPPSARLLPAIGIITTTTTIIIGTMAGRLSPLHLAKPSSLWPRLCRPWRPWTVSSALFVTSTDFPRWCLSSTRTWHLSRPLLPHRWALPRSAPLVSAPPPFLCRTLVRGADSALLLTPAITLFSGGTYFRLNSTLPAGRWVDLRIVGRGNQTFAAVRETSLDAKLPVPSDDDAEGEEEFLAVLGINGVSFVWTPVAIEAPISSIGGEDAGWTGRLAAFSLSSET